MALANGVVIKCSETVAVTYRQTIQFCRQHIIYYAMH